MDCLLSGFCHAANLRDFVAGCVFFAALFLGRRNMCVCFCGLLGPMSRAPSGLFLSKCCPVLMFVYYPGKIANERRPTARAGTCAPTVQLTHAYCPACARHRTSYFSAYFLFLGCCVACLLSLLRTWCRLMSLWAAGVQVRCVLPPWMAALTGSCYYRARLKAAAVTSYIIQYRVSVKVTCNKHV